MGILSSKLSAKQMGPLCRQLATTYDAGIPIIKGLELTARNMPSQKSKKVVQSMASDIRDGATLTDAARARQGLFPQFFVEVLGAGETGGRLDVLLRELADYYENLHAMMRAAVVSMVYPCIQLAAAWFLGTFALGIVKNLNIMSGDPFSIGNYVRAYLRFQSVALLIFFALVVAFIVLSRLGLTGRLVSAIKNSVWPIRSISRKFALARFFRSMSLLIGAGLDIRMCVQRSAAVTMNQAIEKDLLRAIPIIANGGSLVEAFSGCKSVSRVGQEMIAVGEHSGRLDASLNKVAEYHFNEARAAVQIATKIANVAIMLFVGAIVGYVIITFYATLYGEALSGL